MLEIHTEIPPVSQNFLAFGLILFAISSGITNCSAIFSYQQMEIWLLWSFLTF